MSSISIKRNNYSEDSCLFSVELIPEYENAVKVFYATMMNNPVAKKSIVYSLFGDEKSIDSLLDEYGVDAFDPIVPLTAAVSRKNRLMICINNKRNNHE
ncbi:hypothetical protein IKF12_03155 [Candidatus Saccharibacteria bacterium]|nr:hypothetical protein [Candidatus Saccharibacteria bacterium]